MIRHRVALIAALLLLAIFSFGCVATDRPPMRGGVVSDCPKCDFSGQNLRSLDFSGGDFSGANFTNAIVSGADFSGSNLSGADFTGADVSNVNFAGANLNGTILPGQ